MLLNANISYAQDNADPPEQAPSTPTSEQTDAPTARSKERPQQENKNENSDPVPLVSSSSEEVSIEERAVNISEKANFWAMMQTIINGLGFFSVLVATLFAGLAWRASKRAADTADKTLAETERTTELEMQPYLSCEGVTVDLSQIGEDKGILVQMSILVRNNGKTPAYVEQCEDCSFGTFNALFDLERAKPNQLHMAGRAYIAPDKTETIYLASAYHFDNFKDGGVLEGLSISGDINVHHWDHFTPKGRRKATSFRFMWNDTTRMTSDDKSVAKLTRTERLRMQDIKRDE